MDKKVLSNFIKSFRKESAKFPDKRVGKNSVYKMEDIVLSAFSMFHMQLSSFLSFQRIIQRKEGRSNAKSLFGIEKIPSDNHIRDILDNINPKYISSMFEQLLSSLKNSNTLENYKYLDSYLVLLDGTNYYSSKTKGYHLEHNFGHGKRHLSGFLFTLNILAFLLHTLLEYLDENYTKARESSTRVEFFNTIEVLTR